MDAIQLIILGMVQGLLEWVAVSSKTQVVLLALSFGIDAQRALAIALLAHIGTTLAALVYFRKEIRDMLYNADRTFKNILKGEWNDTERRSLFLVVATICTAIVGIPLFLLLLYFTDIANAGRGILAFVIGFGLILTGIIAIVSNKAGSRKEKAVGLKDAILVGSMQGLSVLPGVSRSGTTIGMLLSRGFTQESAIRLSFLLSIPTLLGAKIIYPALDPSSFVLSIPDFLILTTASFLVGLASMRIVISIAKRIPFGIIMCLYGFAVLAVAYFSRV